MTRCCPVYLVVSKVLAVRLAVASKFADKVCSVHVCTNDAEWSIQRAWQWQAASVITHGTPAVSAARQSLQYQCTSTVSVLFW